MGELTIGKRMALGFGVVLFLLAISSLVNYRGIAHVVEAARESIDGNRLDRVLAQKEIDHLNWVARVNAFLTDPEINELTVQTDDHKCGLGSWLYGGGAEEAVAMVPELKPLIASLEAPHKRLHRSAIDIAGAYRKDPAAATAIFNTSSLPALREIQAKLHKIRKIAAKRIVSEEAVLAAARHGETASIIVFLAAMAAGLAAAWLISRSITAILARAADELGGSAAEVNQASSQIAASSQALANGATQQAAAVSETSASMEEMGAMAAQNRESAENAEKLMQEGSQNMSRAAELMQRLQEAMNEISTASGETQKIIKTIDEIAFQTNLLALNAAVEAARAGEAGAGFAVVADEVRSLAMRAGKAARETSEMIEKTVATIGRGIEVTTETTEAFGVSLDSINKTAAIMDEIALASKQQSEGIEQANKAINEIDSVTQQNVAYAEESASAASMLSEQAANLDAVIRELLKNLGRAEAGLKILPPPSGP